jgi:hypothetical protein
MARRIQIKRRIGSPGRPDELAPGELAYTDPLTDAGDALFIGNGEFVKTLVSAERQVELDGEQIIRGEKTIDIANLKITGGQAGDVIETDGEGNLRWTSAGGGGLPTGFVGDTLDDEAPYGWVLAFGTIGNAASEATNRAHADCERLFKMMYRIYPDEIAPVSDGRGESADADWLANKTIGGLDFRGVVRAGMDDMGEEAAGRLTGYLLGMIGGLESVALSGAQMPVHAHGASGAGLVGWNLSGGTGRAVGTADGVNSGHFQEVAVSVQNAGGNQAHLNVQPTRTVTTIIKL